MIKKYNLIGVCGWITFKLIYYIHELNIILVDCITTKCRNLRCDLMIRLFVTIGGFNSRNLQYNGMKKVLDFLHAII